MSITFTVPTTPLALNVANRSASLILYGLLDYAHDEVDPWGGELDPADVMRRLATVETRISGLVTPERRERGVYVDENGVGEGCLVVEAAYYRERIERYVVELRRMAERAASLGEVISYW